MTFQQQATLGNAARTICRPIDWTVILQKPAEFTPASVRTYLFDVVERLNKHLAIWMDGPSMCKLRVTRDGTNGAPVEVSLSTWRASQLFPHMVQCNWVENGKKKTLFRNAIDLFLHSRNRKEIYQMVQPIVTPLRESPAIEWLKTQLSLPTECCSIKWGGLNPRKIMYETFVEEVVCPEDWMPKRISQELYSVIPGCRPVTGSRIRRNGIAMMYVPSRERCDAILDAWVQKNHHANLRF